jgi:hypothetical protein
MNRPGAGTRSRHEQTHDQTHQQIHQQIHAEDDGAYGAR